jgi:hypothetical protein
MIKLPYALSFPWRFDIRSTFKLLPSTPKLSRFLSSHNAGFLAAFKSVITAVSESDSHFLNKVMEPRLAKALEEGLAVIRRRNNELKLVNEGEYVTSYFYNERLYLGVDIVRDHNSNTIIRHSLADLNGLLKWNSDCRVPVDNVRLYYDTLTHLKPKVTLKVDVLYSSPVKLILFDPTGECVRGQKNYMPETHKLRFEIMQTFPQSSWGRIKASMELVKFARGAKSDLFRESDWVITDMDDYLEGNAFVVSN